jgi:hypothetical protein
MGWLKAVWAILKYAPAVIEVVRKSRERHPDKDAQAFVAPKK